MRQITVYFWENVSLLTLNQHILMDANTEAVLGGSRPIQEDLIFQSGKHKINNSANKYSFHPLAGKNWVLVSISYPSWASRMDDKVWSPSTVTFYCGLHSSIALLFSVRLFLSIPPESFPLHKSSWLSQQRSPLISTHAWFSCSTFNSSCGSSHHDTVQCKVSFKTLKMYLLYEDKSVKASNRHIS